MISLTKYTLVCLILCYPLLPLVKENSLVIGNIVEGVLLLVLTACSFLRVRRGAFSFNAQPRILWAIGMLTLAFLVSQLDLFYDLEFYDTLSAVRMLLFYILLLDCLDQSKERKLSFAPVLNKAIMLSIVLFAIGSVVQILSPQTILNLHGSDALMHLRSKSDFTAFSIYNRAMSFALDSNILGTFSALTLEYFWQLKNNISSKMLYIDIGSATVSILLSQSRTVIATVLFYFALIKFYCWNTSRKISLKMIVFLIPVVAVGFVIIKNCWDAILSYLMIETLLSGNGRLGHNAEEYIFLTLDVLGTFMGNGLSVARKIIFENSYLALFYEFGVIGFIIFVGTSYLLIHDTLRYTGAKIL